MHQNGRILLRLDELEQRLHELESDTLDEPEGLPIGSEAVAFELPDLTGERKSLAQYRGQPVLLLFFNPACGFCRELLPKLERKGEERRTNGEDRPLLIIISAGGAEANRTLFEQHKVSCPVLLQKESEAAAAYKANGTPSGYLIDPKGRIASGLAMGGEAFMELLQLNAENGKQKAETDQAGGNGDGPASRFKSRSLPKSKIKRDGLKAGTVAPDFRLPRLDGRGEMELNDLRGRRVLLVFSSPGCGPCNTLAPQVEKFHREHPEIELVMISKGEPKENRAKAKEHGLTFPIVLQQQWEISRLYAMFATPIAYLIDEHGIISHDVAVGVEPILSLMARVGRCKGFARNSSRESIRVTSTAP
jgi:peroxiredoxin